MCDRKALKQSRILSRAPFLLIFLLAAVTKYFCFNIDLYYKLLTKITTVEVRFNKLAYTFKTS